MLHRGDMDDGCWIWLIWLRELLVWVLVGWLAPRWNPDGNNNVDGFDNVDCTGNGDILSLFQGHGRRQDQESAESEGCG